MARVDYFGIEAAIQDILQADANLSGVQVLVEPAMVHQEGDVVAIYVDRRSAPADLQTISAGTRTRFLVSFSLWCYHMNLDVPTALQKRDDLMGKVEVALMAVNRNLNSTVNMSWLEGGEFLNGQSENNDIFMAGGEIQLIADVTATT